MTIDNRNIEKGVFNQFCQFFADYVAYHQTQLRDYVVGRAKDAPEQRNVAIAQLAMDTFMHGGYGEAYDADANTESLRLATKYMDQIEQDLNKLRDGTIKSSDGRVIRLSLLQLKEIGQNVSKNLAAFQALNLEPMAPQSPLVQLGWGHTQQATESLENIRGYEIP